jgi:uncharacterized protein
MANPIEKRTVYLDIETSYEGAITIIGLYTPWVGTQQLVGGEVTAFNLLEALRESEVIKTYNGDRFDLPVIQQKLGVDLKALFPHDDLMYRCWRQKLKGGLKAVEVQLGLKRQTQGVDGLQAMALWAEWKSQGRRESLEKLLLYNREDVELLEQVESRLEKLENRKSVSG